MAYSATQFGAPVASDVQMGRYTHFRIWRCEASVAAPVTSVDIYGIQNISLSAGEPKFTKEVFQQGGGDESLLIKRDYNWTGSISFLKKKGLEELQHFTGATWTTAGAVAYPHYFDNEFPSVIMELVNRDEDNATHLFSTVVVDAVLDSFGFENPMDDAEWVLPFHTTRVPITICANTKFVYDQFNGVVSAGTYTLSSTPLPLLTATSWRYFDYNQLYYVKEKLTGASTGTLIKSGYSNSGATLTAANAVAASTAIQVGYVAAM